MTCEDCGRTTVPDITGELRCKPCDEAIERMVRGWWEDDVAEGRA